MSSSPENVPEKTPGAWLTKLSMMAPGLRECWEIQVAGLEPFVLQFAWKTHFEKKIKPLDKNN